jgi:acyl-CoA synthetase (NDP forming)
MKTTESSKVIKEALARGQSTLSEFDSKRFLSCFGIPIAREAIARDADSAVAEAERIGFPVALKACGQNLVHKTEAGGVVLNLRSLEEIKEASGHLLEIQGCESLLVQEIVEGDRELVCGMTRDESFGPCIMFGIGGVLTEVIKDAVFRLAPVTPFDALEMIKEIQNKRILGPFRGQAAADVDTISRISVSLGEIGLQNEDVVQIDINPLKIRPDGKPAAVDALVVLRGRTKSRSEKPDETECFDEFDVSGKSDLKSFFEPSRVVIIGASAIAGKPGNDVIKNIVANGFSGEVFLVNPKGGEISGLPVSSSIADLPEGIDLAIVILAAELCPQALRDCAAKGIRNIVISAGGFAEVDDKRSEIQRELIEIIEKERLRVLGPNTSGHTSTPRCFTSTFFPLGKIRRGTVSYIAQTGNFATHTMKYILTAEYFGVSRVIGLGNAIDIDESDALQYLGDDHETSAIVMYLESIRRPRSLLGIARKITRKKPVIMLKSGSTEAGKQAAVAHTASMASEDHLVEGLLNQAGIVRISEYTHLILAAKALSMVPLPKGNRVSFLAPSGAMLVVLADLCMRLGLEVPELTRPTLNRLQEISPSFIRMRNPVDIWAAASTKGVEFGYREGIKAVLRDPNIDAVVPVLMLTKETGIPSYEFIVQLSQKHPEKPILVTFSGAKRYIDECRDFLEPRGVPTFAEIEQPFEIISILSRCHNKMNRSR